MLESTKMVTIEYFVLVHITNFTTLKTSLRLVPRRRKRRRRGGGGGEKEEQQR